MKALRMFVLMLFTLTLAPSLAAAQDGATVSGRVMSDAGAPLAGATVFVEGLNLGTTTGDDGRYSFTVPAARLQGQTVTITARRIGYAGRSARIALRPGNISQDFTLALNPLRLGEVVVTGAGTTTTREKLGNVVNTVDSTLIARSNEANVVQALAGKAPNIEINQQSGEPGAGSYIRIRGAKSIQGTGQPLFVVDGVPIDNTSFATGPSTASTVVPNRASDINPSDIASVEVLKGSAAAAIYGARAAQGVVLITTKSGQAGATRWSLRSNMTWNTVNKRIPLQTSFAQGTTAGCGITATNCTPVPNLAGTVDHCIIRNARNCVATGFSWGPRMDRDAYIAALTRLTGSAATAEQRFNELYPSGLVTYDHWDELFDTGFDSDVTLSASGGNERTTFYLSLGRLDQNGVIVGPNNWYDRSTVRLKATHRLRDRLQVGGNISYIDTRGSFIQKGSNLSGLLLGSMRTPPNYNSQEYRDPETGLHRSYRFPRPATGSETISRIYDNPFFVANEVPNQSELGRTIGNVDAVYDPTGWLTIRYTFGGDYYADWRLEALPLTSGSYGPGRVIRADLINYSLDHNLNATARRTFSDNFAGTLVLGQNLTSRRYRQYYTTGFDLIAPEPFAIHNTTTWEPSEFRSRVNTESYYGQATADLFEQLYLTAGLRNDGFSTFGAAKRRHWFPKVSAAWVVTNAFGGGQGIGPISFAKLRLAYGETGKEPGVYQTVPTTMTVGGSFGGGWGDYLNANQAGIGGLYTSRSLGNEAIGPERTKETEGGIDLGLFNQMADLGLTFYNSKSEDVILLAPAAPSTGYTSKLENAARISNKGVEATLNVRPVTRPMFSWDFGINYARNRNKVLDLRGAEFVDKSAGTFGGSYGSVTKGSEVGVIRGEDFVRCGRGLTVGGINIDEVAGHCLGAAAGALYIGANGYPVYDETDRIIANPNPRWTGSFRTSLNVRGVTFSALVDHKHGGDIWNGTKGALYFFGTHADTEFRDQRAVFGTNYMPANPGGSAPVAGPGAGKEVNISYLGWYAGNIGSGFTGPSAQFIEDGTYTKLREVSVGYTFSNPILLRGFGFSSMELRVAGRNLKTWTDYTGIDPETNLGGAEVFVQGIDYFNNPQTRSFVLSVGLNR